MRLKYLNFIFENIPLMITLVVIFGLLALISLIILIFYCTKIGTVNPIIKVSGRFS
jgi:hypothetical protein